jgi:hypothetical protein
MTITTCQVQKTMDIRFQTNGKIINELKALLEIKTVGVMEAALTLLTWAAREIKAGRVITSMDPDDGNIRQLVMPALETIRPSDPALTTKQVGD